MNRRVLFAMVAVVGVSSVLFVSAALYATVPLSPVPAFIASYQSALAINDLITAVLLFSQFSIVRSRALLLLASGYLFTAFAAVVHALSFPGLFAKPSYGELADDSMRISKIRDSALFRLTSIARGNCLDGLRPGGHQGHLDGGPRG